LTDVKVFLRGTRCFVRMFVAFSARTDKGGTYGNFQGDITLTYNALITNVGNAYNPTTGIFTAPVKGLYYFTYFAHSGGKNCIKLDLRKDGAMVADADTADNAGNAVFLELEQGNQVYQVLSSCSLFFLIQIGFFKTLFLFITQDDGENLIPLCCKSM
uniref:C1q domain-containing protein n=1 Tax=Oryzias latipes TaxID=8090 RepID=A0A3P9MIA4_ORYLA